MAVESKRVVAILLAAGRSERFGRDKLAEHFQGAPLAHHAARVLSEIDFARRIAVVGSTSVDFMPLGFDIVRPAVGSPISASIAVGVEEAVRIDCDACLVALADMPFVSVEHFHAMLGQHHDLITATLVENRKVVPALFDRAMFAQLCQLEGDQGAAKYLMEATAVSTTFSAMTDIDVPSDLTSFC